MTSVSVKVKVRRLRKLAEFLRKLPRRKFDFGQWGGNPAKPDEPFKLDPVKCKTVACAAGWATCIPEFRRAGLRLEVTKGDYGGIFTDVVCGDYQEGSAAMAEVLGLDEEVAEDYFTEPRTYGVHYYEHVTPKLAARGLAKLAHEIESGKRTPLGTLKEE